MLDVLLRSRPYPYGLALWRAPLRITWLCFLFLRRHLLERDLVDDLLRSDQVELLLQRQFEGFEIAIRLLNRGVVAFKTIVPDKLIDNTLGIFRLISRTADTGHQKRPKSEK